MLFWLDPTGKNTFYFDFDVPMQTFSPFLNQINNIFLVDQDYQHNSEVVILRLRTGDEREWPTLGRILFDFKFGLESQVRVYQ